MFLSLLSILLTFSVTKSPNTELSLASSSLTLSVKADSVYLKKLEKTANNLYSIGEFAAAVLEYKRLLFILNWQDSLSRETDGKDSSSTTTAKPYLTPAPQENSQEAHLNKTAIRSSNFRKQRHTEQMNFLKLKLALALYQNEEKSEADAILYELDDPVVRMVRAVILMREDNPFLAAREINSSTQSAIGTPAFRLRGWAYMQALQFERSATEFRKAGDLSLAEAAAELKNIRLKNPKTARWLSLLPGLGEAYAGRPFFGLWSFLVNAGDTYLIANAIIKRNYVDAVLTYMFLWQRFYSGSMANADRFAHEWNTAKIKQALEPIRGRWAEKEALRLDLQTLEHLYFLAKTASH